MMSDRFRLCVLLAGLAVLVSTALPARAAGPFDVEDPGVLASSACEAEGWLEHARKERSNLRHLAVGCGVGPLELRVGMESIRPRSTGGDVGAFQLKWGLPGLTDVPGDPPRTWAATLALAAARDLGGGASGREVLLPVTWTPDERFSVIANAGYRWADEPDGRRRVRGLALTWSPADTLKAIAERSDRAGAWTNRIGVRAQIEPRTLQDIAIAHERVAGTRLVVGLTFGFEAGH